MGVFLMQCSGPRVVRARAIISYERHALTLFLFCSQLRDEVSQGGSFAENHIQIASIEHNLLDSFNKFREARPELGSEGIKTALAASAAAQRS
jgi:hypothetical protein